MKVKKLKPSQYAPSLLSNEKKCYICGNTTNVELHHIYNGANRNKSSYLGCWCFLCKEHHTGNKGVHTDYDLNLKLKVICQQKFTEKYDDLDFLSIFGKNYL